MKELSLAFLWHMHQPFYKDTLTGTYHMPWVRMHALKGYFDMPSILETFPEIHATFNLVPSLLKQLMDYVDRSAVDIFIEATLKPATELNDADKKFILWNFFMANWDTMIKPYPRYWQLLCNRGFGVISDQEWPVIIRKFSIQDYRDLQMWFNLTWFGYSARKKYPKIKEYIKKGKGFSENDKHNLIELQYEVMSQIIPLYKKLAQRGQIELTTTPMYHPILPLIYDTHFAYRCMPDSILPGRFQYPVDAEEQIKRGVEYFKSIFGFRPAGMWPSEGSVCPEIVPFLAKAGIKWIATDEEVLKYSLGSQSRVDSLFQAYQFVHQGDDISVLFRDKGLSDVIGFTYAKNPPAQSAADFMHHLEDILHTTNIEHPVVGVFLDGENAWEYFPDGGEEFFNQLYTNLSSHKHIHTMRVTDYLKNNPKRPQLDYLHSGSWIDHDFHIWIADKDKNQAWNYLRKTREFVDTWFANNKSCDKNLREKVVDELFMAEGSDWFWWYGEPFSTDNDEEFDRLFRLHLSNVYRLLSTAIPGYLKNPILSHRPEQIIEQPVGFIHPIIDGRKTHFYEWQEAGFYIATKSTATMHKSELFLKTIFYGFDLEHLYLRFDPFHIEILTDSSLTNAIIEVVISTTSKEFVIDFPFERNDSLRYALYIIGKNKKEKVGEYSTIQADSIIELSIPFEDLNLQPGHDVSFFVEIKQDNLSLEKYPHSGNISFSVPDEEFENTMWSV